MIKLFFYLKTFLSNNYEGNWITGEMLIYRVTWPARSKELTDNHYNNKFLKTKNIIKFWFKPDNFGQKISDERYFKLLLIIGPLRTFLFCDATTGVVIYELELCSVCIIHMVCTLWPKMNKICIVLPEIISKNLFYQFFVFVFFFVKFGFVTLCVKLRTYEQ